MRAEQQQPLEKPKGIPVDGLSLIPLMIAPFAEENQLGVATGFVVKVESTPFLITNRHVVTGKDNFTDEMMMKAPPNKLNAKLRVMMSKDFSKIVSWDLFDKQQDRLWFEHPAHGEKVDIVALPIPNYRDDLAPAELDMALKDTDMSLSPTEQVAVIGYPFGKSPSGLLPIWVTGFLASDFIVDWNDLPAFLISTTTKPSMSGSPVIARRIGSVRQTSGTHLMNGAINDKFLGVYSGRLSVGDDFKPHDGLDSHIGIVWRAELVTDIINSAMRQMKASNDSRLNPKQS